MRWASPIRSAVRSTIAAGIGVALMVPLGDLRARADAASYAWRPVAVGGGGFVTRLDADPTGATRVARTDMYGTYIWRPDLDRWAQLVTTSSMPAVDRARSALNEGVFEVAVAPSNPARIYFVTKSRVYRSDDKGATFARTAPLAAKALFLDPNGEFRHYGPFMAVSPVNPDLVFLGTLHDGLWRSANGGASWEKVVAVPDGGDIRPATGLQSPGVVVWFERGASNSATGRVWAASAGNGVFVSDDGGLGFRPLTPAGQPQPTTLKAGVFASNGVFYGVELEAQRVWAYQNETWTDITSRNGLGPRRFTAVAVNPKNAEIFVVDVGGRTYRSKNAGESWDRLPHASRAGKDDPPWLRVSNRPFFAVSSVSFDPVVADRLWVAAGIGVFWADVPADATRIEWVSRTRGIEELATNDVVQAPGQAPAFAAWDFGIHVKADLDAFSTTYGPRERVLIAAQQVAWTPADPKFLVTNASDTQQRCCFEDGDAVMAGFSTDGGRSWRKFAQLPTPPGTSPTDPWRMSFGTIAVAADSVDNIVWAPSFNRSPFYTKDRGRSWSRVVLEGETLPNTGSHAAYMFKRKTLAADRIAPGVFYLYHTGEGANPNLRGLWRTANGGESWTRVFTGEIAPVSRIDAKLRSVPFNEGHLFFTSGVLGNMDTVLRRSIDGGATWTPVSGVDQVTDVAFGKPAAGAGYPAILVVGRVSGRYGIWRSIDNATTWTRIGEFPVGSLDEIVAIEGDKDVFGRVYVGFKGSGWAYGQPSDCAPKPYAFPADNECFAIR